MTIKKTWLDQLSGGISDDILLLKDERGQYYLDRAHEKQIKYIAKNLSVPWGNQLVFSVVVGLAKNLNVESILRQTQQLHSLFKQIYKHFALEDLDSFIPDEHLRQYAYGDFTNNSIRTRSNYLNDYFSLLDSQKRFIRSTFDEPTQKLYEKYVLPAPIISMRELNIAKKGQEESERNRKAETDAVVHMFSEVRAEAHIRFNQVIRLKKAFDDAVSKVENQDASLPLEFHYEESGIVGERWYFKLWDKASFDMVHPQTQTPRKTGQVPYFLEFVKAEKIESAESVEAEGLWFFELVKLGLLKQFQKNSAPELKKQATLSFKKFGYIDEDSAHLPSPFYSGHAGILTQNVYLSANQNLVEGILIDVEPIFVAVHFGMLALELCTTSGARINELFQINYTKDCMLKVKNPGPPPVTRYVLRMIPKGRDEVENFYVTEDIMKIITLIIKMLKQHYQGSIPNVKYGYKKRAHLFEDELKPYVFQYHHRALDDKALNASLKFLTHDMAFETQEGKKIYLKTHLLRHTFATQAVQGEGIPVDIVAILLHQKDYTVTKYYSRPTATQVSESLEELHTAFAGDIDVAELVLRTPVELEGQLNEYVERVGTLNKTLGGICTLDKICPKKMACLGCSAKVPQPENKEELLQEWKFYDEREKYYKNKGINFEVKKCKVAKRAIRKELREIESIVKYREDENYAPNIQFR